MSDRGSRAAAAPDFSRREFALPERLDGPCSYVDWRAASLSLARLNRITGAYTPTLAFLARAILRRSTADQPLHIVDVGCGHGDALRATYHWAQQHRLKVRLTGVDLNPYSAKLARERDRAEGVPTDAITWVTADLFAWQPEHPADLVVSSLFAHHLSDADIVRLLQWCESQARVGWFLSDLVRSERAARLASWLVRLLLLHPFLRHDTAISFRRALSRDDWQQRLAEAGIHGATISPGRGKLAIEHLR